MLKIWGRDNSINVQKVVWTAGELGLAFERIDAGGAFGGLDTPAYLARNPNARIPVIDDDGFVLWESNAIVRYLAHKYGAGGLWPAEPTALASSDKWLDWQQTTMTEPLRVAFWGLIRTPEAERDNAAIAAAGDAAATLWALVDADLAGRDYLAGAQLTIGDIALGAAVHRWYALDLPHPELPNLAAWHARLSERPAFRAGVMLPLS